MDVKLVVQLPGAAPRPRDAFLPQLSPKERFLAFIVFNALGYALQLGSTARLFGSISSGEVGAFARVYSLGNVLSLIGVMFLVGFKEHLAQIAQRERRCSSIVFFGSMAGCLLLPLALRGTAGNALTAACVVVQMGSYWYYLLSYVPWGQQLCDRLLASGLGRARGGALQR